MRKDLACFVMMCFSLNVAAQFNESFSDGDFTMNPAWTGQTANWQIVTSSDVAAGAPNSNTLRLNVPSGGGTTYLYTQVAGKWGQEQSWGFFIGRRGQAYTAMNYTMIWLWGNEPTRTSATIDGYCVRIGDDVGGDEIVLVRVDNGSPKDILVGAALNNDLTDIGFLLRVTRNSAGVWEMFTSPLPTINGTGAIASDVPNATNANVTHGTVTDNTYTLFDDGYIGFMNFYTLGVASRSSQEFDQVQLSIVDGALPVKLERFYADVHEYDVSLHWEVAAELNVERYEILGSDDGVLFSPAGSVAAANKRHYTFPCAPVHPPFYRLRIVDTDGAYEYSKIISIPEKGNLVIKAAPNPAGRSVTVIHPKAAGDCRIRLMNSFGIPVKQINVAPHTKQTRIDLTGLPAGTYHLQFINNKKQINLTIMKR